MTGLELRTRLMPYLPAVSSIALLLSAGLFWSGLTERRERKKHCEEYLAYARHWASEELRAGYVVADEKTPWGGAYRRVESLQGRGPALLISGFPPHTETHFGPADREALLKAWETQPIKSAKLDFHFNGLPALEIAR